MHDKIDKDGIDDVSAADQAEWFRIMASIGARTHCRPFGGCRVPCLRCLGQEGQCCMTCDRRTAPILYVLLLFATMRRTSAPTSSCFCLFGSGLVPLDWPNFSRSWALDLVLASAGPALTPAYFWVLRVGGLMMTARPSSSILSLDVEAGCSVSAGSSARITSSKTSM